MISLFGDVVGVLSSMGQAVDKRRPTLLELLRGVVALLCDHGQATFVTFLTSQCWASRGDEMLAYSKFRQAVGGP